MQFILFTWTLLTSYLCAVAGSLGCSTPSGRNGICVPIHACSNLSNQEYRESSKEPILVCGYDKSSYTLMVCCPSNTCTTLEGVEGTCTALHSCPRLVNMLINNFSSKAVQYVAKSRCAPREDYVVTVCCEPQPEFPSKFTPTPTSSNRPTFSTKPNNPSHFIDNGGNKIKEQTITTTNKCLLNSYPPDPSSNCCGVQATHDMKIVGGTQTAIDEYPWLALIEYVRNEVIELMCGGALISGRYVLTAAHCLMGRLLREATPVNVRLGEYNTTALGQDCINTDGGGVDCTEVEKIIGIEKIIVHENYNNSGKSRNDIGLIRLTQTVQFTDFVRPICLPSLDFTSSPPPNLTLYVAGWGMINNYGTVSEVKMKVGLPYKSYEQCQPSYNVPHRRVQLWEGQICAGGVYGQDSCKGDSGGPLMSLTGRRHDVVGIVSFGSTPCGLDNVPAVYTNVHQYLPWIARQIVD